MELSDTDDKCQLTNYMQTRILNPIRGSGDGSVTYKLCVSFWTIILGIWFFVCQLLNIFDKMHGTLLLIPDCNFERCVWIWNFSEQLMTALIQDGKQFKAHTPQLFMDAFLPNKKATCHPYLNRHICIVQWLLIHSIYILTGSISDLFYIDFSTFSCRNTLNWWWWLFLNSIVEE